MEQSRSTVVPKGIGLGKALTTITSPGQKNRYIITGLLLSAFGFFVASIPMGTVTMVIGRVLLRNRIKAWGYFFCLIGTAWAIGLPLLNFVQLYLAKEGKIKSVTIIPPVMELYKWLFG